MKKPVLLGALIVPLLVVAGFIVNDKAKSKEPVITFYDVPLVCPGAPEIGCGTKAKPILLEMEKNAAIKEAWLNRVGTVIAVVWNENASSELRITTADAIFKENKMDVKLVEGTDYKKLQTDFQEKKNWYRGEDVNKLSMEEEGIIVDRLLKRINSKTPLSQEKIQSLKTEFVAALINRFTKNYTSEFNSNPKVMENAIQESESELLEIGKKYLNEPEMNALKEAMTLGLMPTENEKPSCTKDMKKESCGSKQ